MLADAQPACQGRLLLHAGRLNEYLQVASDLALHIMKNVLQNTHMFRAFIGISVPALCWVDLGLAWAPRAQRSDRVRVWILFT